MSILTSLRESPRRPSPSRSRPAASSAASLEWRGGQPVVSAHATEPLPEGALVPSLTRRQHARSSRRRRALGRVFEQVGRPRRVGLVVPDSRRESVARAVRAGAVAGAGSRSAGALAGPKAAPFPIEEAQVSYVPGILAEDGQGVLVSLARRDVIQEYEGCAPKPARTQGSSTWRRINVINAVLAGSGAPAGDWLLVNIAADYTSIALLRGPT